MKLGIFLEWIFKIIAYFFDFISSSVHRPKPAIMLRQGRRTQEKDRYTQIGAWECDGLCRCGSEYGRKVKRGFCFSFHLAPRKFVGPRVVKEKKKRNKKLIVLIEC